MRDDRTAYPPPTPAWFLLSHLGAAIAPHLLASRVGFRVAPLLLLVETETVS